MKKFLTIVMIVWAGHLISVSVPAQAKNKIDEAQLFDEVALFEKVSAECEAEQRRYQIAQFGRVRPRISGHCWEGGPTRLPRPVYPAEARQRGITGQVKIETIVDETGRVIYTRVLKGQPFLSAAARQAAYFSTYQRKINCRQEPIKFRWIITYNFLPAN